MSDFSKQIVDEIEARGMTPLPRSHFLIRRSVFWALAILSILSGAIAYSVADYVFFDNEGVSAAKLLESPLEGILQTIPVIWLVVLALFVASAFASLRYTRTGYRYRAWMAVIVVLVLSIVLGLLLNTVDFGQAVHYFLLHHTSFYDALIHSSDDLSNP